MLRPLGRSVPHLLRPMRRSSSPDKRCIVFAFPISPLLCVLQSDGMILWILLCARCTGCPTAGTTRPWTHVFAHLAHPTPDFCGTPCGGLYLVHRLCNLASPQLYLVQTLATFLAGCISGKEGQEWGPGGQRPPHAPWGLRLRHTGLAVRDVLAAGLVLVRAFSQMTLMATT